MKFKSSVALISALSILTTACINVGGITGVKEKRSSNNRVTQDSSKVNTVIGDKEVQLQVLSKDSLNDAIAENLILAPSDMRFKAIASSLENSSASSDGTNLEDDKKVETSESSLLVGFPIGLLNEQNIFGGVITKISDKKDANLGMLKLSDLPPMHVRPVLSGDGKGNYGVVLLGCVSQCTENSQQVGLIAFPVVGINEKDNMLILDLTDFGKSLNMMDFQDPDQTRYKLETVANETVSVEYDMKTLVFDTRTKMVKKSTPIPSKLPGTVARTASDIGPVVREVIPPVAQEPIEITTRWYLKLNSGSNPAFEVRPTTKGVGFFTTLRSKSQKITRFSSTDTVKYYIKNVPEGFKASFAKAFENWNEEFRKILGRDYLVYEFIDENDPRNPLIVAGDIRYNVVEWDIHNNASYDGLGPSISNQYSGETLSAQVMIQGMNILQRTAYWYQISGKVVSLKREGKIQEANKILKEFNQEQESSEKTMKFTVQLNDKLSMNVSSQRNELMDQKPKGHFEIVPENVSLIDYLDAYFTHVLTHELGHNLGLRHNFKGSLGSHDADEHGKKVVSRSIMEYLGLSESHLSSEIGDYDRMAIAYGYGDVAPTEMNWFCSDEDEYRKASDLKIKSPECSKYDGSNDPYSFWEKNLDRSLDLLLEKGSNSDPVWKYDEIAGRIDQAVIQLSQFALSADKTAHTWTSFFGREGRPENKDGVKAYVLQSLKSKICNQKNFEVINAKETEEGKSLATKNMMSFMQLVVGRTGNLKLFTPEDFTCN